MSRYLIDRIEATPNVELLVRTVVSGIDDDGGDGVLAHVDLINAESGVRRRVDAAHLFLFVGADPNSAWLDGCVRLDDKGFVLTGQNPQRPLETSSHGVFAIGDIRSQSIKRVAAGVGEGAAVVAQIHAVLAGVGAQTAPPATAIV